MELRYNFPYYISLRECNVFESPMELRYNFPYYISLRECNVFESPMELQSASDPAPAAAASVAADAL